jgi:hypothetical protein
MLENSNRITWSAITQVVNLGTTVPTLAIIGAVTSYADQIAWHGRRPIPIADLLCTPLRAAAGGRR